MRKNEISTQKIFAKEKPYENTDANFLNSKLKNEDGKYNLSEEVFKKDSFSSFFQKLIKQKADEPKIENLKSKSVFLLKPKNLNEMLCSIGIENLLFETIWKLTSNKFLNNKNINTVFAKIMNIATNFLKYELKYNNEQSSFLKFFQTHGFSLLSQLIIKVNISLKNYLLFILSSLKKKHSHHFFMNL